MSTSSLPNLPESEIFIIATAIQKEFAAMITLDSTPSTSVKVFKAVDIGFQFPEDVNIERLPTALISLENTLMESEENGFPIKNMPTMPVFCYFHIGKHEEAFSTLTRVARAACARIKDNHCEWHDAAGELLESITVKPTNVAYADIFNVFGFSRPIDPPLYGIRNDLEITNLNSEI